jgi:integrase
VRRTTQAGYIFRHRGWWVLRYRERVGTGGEVRVVQRAQRLVPVDAEYKTRASVRELAQDFLRRFNSTPVSPLQVTTLGDFCERVYLPFVREYKHPSTVRGYAQMWNGYLKKRCQSAWLRDVKTHDVQVWLEGIAKEHGLSKTTLKHIKHFFGGLFRHAIKQDFFDSTRANPVTMTTIPPHAPNAAEGQAYTPDQIARMVELLPEPASTVVAVAAFTGLRRGELRGLTWEAYTPAASAGDLGTLRVTRSIWGRFTGDPKTEKSKAPVPVIPQLADKLAAHRTACGNPSSGPIFANIFGRPLDLEGLYKVQMKDLLPKANIAWHGWHAFRRGLASNLNRLGVDDSVIQSILRHSTVLTTQTHYIKTTRPDAVGAMRRLSEALLCSMCAPNGDGKPQRMIQ